MRLRDILTTDELMEIGRLQQKMLDATNLENYNLYKRYIGLIMKQALERHKQTLK